MEGLIGLQGPIRDRENANRELAVYETMDRIQQQDRAQNLLAQQQEVAMFEQMYEKADGLLEKDRNRINARIAMAQKQVKNHLSQFGGQRAQWMANGGMSELSSIKNSILGSEEMTRYNENKKNLAKILELKEKNLGHLIAPRDLDALEAYQNNEEGAAITYSGIMNEIDLPPAEAFDYGTDIPAENILSYGSNYMKILENWRTQYPDIPNPTPAQLAKWTSKMYGGVGTNTARLREQYKLAQQQAKAKADRDAAKGEGPGTSYINEVNTLMSRFDKGITAQDVIAGKRGDGSHASFGAMLKDPNFTSANKLLGDKYGGRSRNRALAEQGLDKTDVTWDAGRRFVEDIFNEEYGVMDGYKVLDHNANQIAARLFNQEVANGKILDFEPSETDYRMDGVQLTGEYKLDYSDGDHKGTYTLDGITTAWKMADNTGNHMLMMNAYNDNGTIDQDKQEKINAGYKGEAIPTMVMAIKDEDGNLFYREIDLTQPYTQNVMKEALAADDNITDVVKQQNQAVAEIKAISENTTEEQLMFRNTNAQLDEQIFNDPAFDMEGEKYYGAGSGGQANRHKMMKAWYMAFDYINNSYQRSEQYPEGNPAIVPSTVQFAVDREMFTNSAAQGGIEDDLRKYGQGNGEEKIIAKWMENVNADLEPGSIEAQMNQELASKWLQVLELL